MSDRDLRRSFAVSRREKAGARVAGCGSLRLLVMDRSPTGRSHGGPAMLGVNGRNDNGARAAEKAASLCKPLKALASGAEGSSRTRFENCESTSAHDLQLNGPDTLSSGTTGSATSTSTASSLARRRPTCASPARSSKLPGGSSVASKSTAGTVVLHRNLIDVCQATVGRRPIIDPTAVPEDEQPEIFGNMFESNFADPNLAVSHNTVLINQTQRVTPDSPSGG